MKTELSQKLYPFNPQKNATNKNSLFLLSVEIEKLVECNVLKKVFT